MSEDGGEPTKKIEFYVAIQKDKDGIMSMLTPEVVSSIDLKKVIKSCHMEDNIMIITKSRSYSLSHHLIEIMWKC